MPVQGGLGAEDGEQGQGQGIRIEEKARGDGAPADDEKGENAGGEGGDQVGLVHHPEDIAVQQQVPHRAAAQARGHRHHDRADQVHALAFGFKDAGGGTNRHGHQADPVEQIGQQHQTLTRIRRCFSRSQSRCFSVSRLSCIFLPLARPTSTFTRPRV